PSAIVWNVALAAVCTRRRCFSIRMGLLRLLLLGSRAVGHAQLRADFSAQLLPDAFKLPLTQLAPVIQFPKLSKLVIGVESRRDRTLAPAVEHRDGDGSYDDY